ncbi:gamma-glutamyltransferase [Oceanimonas sp. NS1]|nr:gamma-glutamyltransferase [Oceanimonas sp. NS1]
MQAKQAMVVTANPHASRAAQAMLVRGGRAVDAMIAAQMVLTLVEPQSSGLGGGGFWCTGRRTNGGWSPWMAGNGPKTGTCRPLPRRPWPVPWLYGCGGWGTLGGHAGHRDADVAGTPAFWRIALAGFVWPGHYPGAERIYGFSPAGAADSRQSAQSRQGYQQPPLLFDDKGRPLSAGSHLVNPLLAALLTRLSIEGPSAFYQGKIAELMVDKVRNAAAPGHLALDDLTQYRVQERPPLCFPYRQYNICGMGPPGSGTLALGQILGMLAHFDLSRLGPNSPQAWRLVADASRLAFADRGRYAADSDFVPVPVEGLLDRDYLAQRAQLLKGADKALPEVTPGTPKVIGPLRSTAHPNFPQLPTSASSTAMAMPCRSPPP